MALASTIDQKERRRREILDAAKQVFAEHGYHRASINDIIERASIARGTFYLYFSSKQAIFDSILQLAIEELRARILPVNVGPGAASPGAQLHANLTRVLQYVLGDRALIQILLNHGLAPDSEVKERIDAFYAHVLELLSSALSYGIEAGWLRQLDVQLVAAGLLGTLRGVIAHLIARDADTDPAELDHLASELIAFALGGVAGKGWTTGS